MCDHRRWLREEQLSPLPAEKFSGKWFSTTIKLHGIASGEPQLEQSSLIDYSQWIAIRLDRVFMTIFLEFSKFQLKLNSEIRIFSML